MNTKDKTNIIFSHKTLKAIADSMIKVFIPLLILKSTGDMNLVMIYLCAYYPICAVLNFVLKKFLQKYGLFAIILHFIPIVAVQFMLNITLNWWICILLALLMSFSQVLYSVPLNILFSVVDKNVNVTKFQISSNVGKLIFILLSGYILGSSINNSLIIVSIVSSVLYLISSCLLLFAFKDIKQAYDNIKTTPVEIDKKSYWLFNLFHMQFGIFQSILDIILPLFLFLNNLTFQSVTIVMALIEVCKIGANILAKIFVKKNLRIVSVLISLSVMIASCFIVMFVRNTLVLYICSCCLGISFPLLFVPMFSLFTKKVVKDNNQFEGMAERDVYIFAGRDILYVPYFVVPDLVVQFVIGIICSVGLGITSAKLISKQQD